MTDNSSDLYKNPPTYYTIEMYEDVGRSLAISILDIFEKNPCSRIGNTPYLNLENVRKEIATKISKVNRLRKIDGNLGKKCKKINDLANQIFYDDFKKKNCFNETRQHFSPCH